MFNIGFTELIVVLLVAFLIVGPKDLPKVAKWLARQLKNLRRIIKEVKSEVGWDEIAAELKDTRDDVKNTLKQADVTQELRSVKKDVEASVSEVRRDVESLGEEIEKSVKQ